MRFLCIGRKISLRLCFSLVADGQLRVALTETKQNVRHKELCQRDMTVNIHFFQGSDSTQFQPAIIQGNHLTCLRQDGLACDRQPDAGACACEQLDSQFLFHGLEGLRQTGLRQIEFLGGSPDGTCLCDSNEIFERCDLHTKNAFYSVCIAVGYCFFS